MLYFVTHVQAGSEEESSRRLERAESEFFLNNIWDGIHQIVSRFVEQFRYMCPLLFSCVFPS
jgi:hypothetical protein